MPVSAWFWQVLCKQYLRGSSRGRGRLFLSSSPPQEFQAGAELYFGCFWIKHCRCCGHTIDHNICTYVICSHITARGADRARFVSSASWQFLQLSLLSSPGGIAPSVICLCGEVFYFSVQPWSSTSVVLTQHGHCLAGDLLPAFSLDTCLCWK